ncbi:AraC family transcriptional regulator [Sphingomonas parva]|uniref:AraC family transcriptional regulator n=1 Tax=Sphingomonas parva TaxID=2555898 RepID=A0A4Y8ZW01_9SPHN|nr:helix-turn-helix domain-containing protein [Sphingomonas parva]TFI58616.1 AraC family transcriptional regulator [Sphingomonas parva]
MIRFGAWSTVLAVLAVQLLVLAAALAAMRANRLANRLLAALLLVMAGMMIPFVLGYAGFYDAYPWLTAAPFSIPLAVGPLVYAHVVALAEDRPLRAIHVAAPAAQFAYQLALFPFPVASKTWWDEQVHAPFVAAPLAAAILVSMAAYSLVSQRALRRYEQWLAERRRSPAPARRLRTAVLLLAILLCARAGYELFDAMVRPIDYFDLFGFYLLLGALGLFVGVNGWRHAADPAPAIAEPAERNWPAQGAEWLQRLRDGGWWREPSLDLARLARLLGTNTSHLSRALNAAGAGFAAELAAIRAEAVAAAIDAGAEADLLALALDAGFGSKASFNRAFRARYGVSPSAYRARRRRLSE